MTRWLLLSMLVLSPAAFGASYYMAPDGNDGNPGTREKPFASIRRAQEAAAPGDTVYLRGGTYRIQEKAIAQKQGIWAYVHVLDKSGEAGRPINYFAAEGEKPVFDFSGVKPEGLRVTAFFVTGSYLHFRGFEVTGVQVTIKTHTQSECFENNGSHNVYELLSLHDGQAIGIYCLRGSDNLFLNCDAYRNWDYTSEDGRGGNVDGFGCHPRKGSINNVFRGCRAWFNSDDGYDCINSAEPVVFDHCWAFYNGYSTKFQSLGDGNGFKAGGYGKTPAERLPNPIPRHVVRYCVAVRNKANGVYANHHVGGDDFLNNTSFHNGTDFNFLCRLADNRTDVAGYGHRIENNLAPTGPGAVKNLDAGKCEVRNNSFTGGVEVKEGDFESTDEKFLTAPRQANGDLPEVPFLRFKAGSVAGEAGMGAFAGK